jgi:uncharacterized protein (TIGR00730 family)
MTKDNGAQKASPAYILPALDSEFLLGDSTRGIRLHLEYQKAEEILRSWTVRSTIVVFGSARVRPSDARDAPAADLFPQNATVPGSRAGFWYEQARCFGRIASQRGGALLTEGGVRDNIIATGGGPGIMEAANRGAMETGAPTIGFNIGLPREQEPNAYSTPELTFQFHYFAVRKFHFAIRANALVVFPGGFGTLDELFELLTLMQTMKMHRIPVVMVDRDYWSQAINFEHLVRAGMVDRADLELFSFADDAEGAWTALLQRGLRTGPRPTGYPST